MRWNRLAVPLVVFALLGSVARTDVYVVDNDDGAPAFQQSGPWKVSTSTGYNGGTYLFVLDTDPASWCSWTPTLATAGDYEVFAIFRSSTNRTVEAPYLITHADGTTTVTISQLGPNTMTEVYLGTFRFEVGTAGTVQLQKGAASGAYIADAMRFQTATDDPPVIQSVGHVPVTPIFDQTVTVTAQITDDGSVTSASLHYEVSGGATVDEPMLDDGLHGDGTAGDHLYGASIPPQSIGAVVTYVVTAVDNGGQSSSSASVVYTVNATAPPEYRSIWVDAWSTGFLSPAQAEELIQTCRNNNINTVMAEIRKVGDAYYNSTLEPRATNISGGSSYDPLGYLIQLAHDTSGGKKYIQIHAWFVMQRITTGGALNPQHVLVQHPEYVMSDSTGNTGSGSTQFLDPGHPGAVDHNVAVVLDCLSNYDIDGINFDYIRYPEASGSWGYNPVSVQRFNAFYGKAGQPATSDPDWAAWRRECVTLEVKKIYIKSALQKRGVVVTADTVNWGSNYTNATYPNSSAYAQVFQDWVGWLEQGILDYNALMDYATSNSRYAGWMNLSLGHDDKRGSIIGVGAYLQATVQNSMDQLLLARNAGAAGVNIYDWYSEVNAAPDTREQFFAQLKTQVFPNWADPPVPAWKATPTTGIFQGTVTAGGVPVDHATITIEGRPETATRSDGSGWYGLLFANPDTQQLRFSKTGYNDLVASTSIPKAGDIVTLDADFLATPTLTPTPTPTESPSPTPSLTPSPTASPTESPTPTPTPPSNTFDFPVGDPEGWTFHLASPLTAPTSATVTTNPGFLRIQATDNVANFGYWESPEFPFYFIDTVPSFPLLIADWRVTTDCMDPSIVPQLRLRITTADLQRTDMVTIESNRGGPFSPTPQGTTVRQVLAPSYVWNRFLAAFDLLNFESGDAERGILDLDRLKVGGTLVAYSGLTRDATITFAQGPGDWEQRATSQFDAPVFSYDPAGSGSLVLSPGGSANAFGYWSPRNPVVPVNPGKVYFVQFNIRARHSSPDQTRLPSFRLRCNESGMRVASMTRLNFPSQVEPGPDTSQHYMVTFHPTVGMEDAGLLLAFDLMSFDPTADLSALLYLDTVEVFSIPGPAFEFP